MIGAVVGVQPFGGEGLSGTGPKAGGPRYLHRFATERTLTDRHHGRGRQRQPAELERGGRGVISSRRSLGGFSVDERTTEPKKRRAWLAALLSLLLPGLGQLYNRQVRLALILMILALLLSMPTRWLIAAVPSESVVTVAAVAIVCGLALPLFAIVQAAIGARRAGAISLAWFNRWFVYVGLIVVDGDLGQRRGACCPYHPSTATARRAAA